MHGRTGNFDFTKITAKILRPNPSSNCWGSFILLTENIIQHEKCAVKIEPPVLQILLCVVKKEDAATRAAPDQYRLHLPDESLTKVILFLQDCYDRPSDLIISRGYLLEGSLIFISQGRYKS